MEIISQAEMNARICDTPEEYLLSVLNRKVSDDNERIWQLSSFLHVYQVKYMDEYYYGIVHNMLKMMPQHPEMTLEDYIDNNAPDLDQVNDQVIEHKGDSYLMLLHPKIKPKLKNRYHNLYLTEKVRHKGKNRTGIVCVYMKDVHIDQLPEINLISIRKRTSEG